MPARAEDLFLLVSFLNGGFELGLGIAVGKCAVRLQERLRIVQCKIDFAVGLVDDIVKRNVENIIECRTVLELV